MSVPGLRSWLFVPGDSARKQARALDSAADALILDLEDSVEPPHLPAARAQVAATLAAPARPSQERWVRVNSADSGHLLPDLVAVVTAAAAPHGLVLPKVSSVTQLDTIAHYLDALEHAAGRPPGAVRLLVIATETPAAVLALPQYPAQLSPGVRARLAGLTWGMEDLGTALGARAQRKAGGALIFPFQVARAACLFTAASLGVPAIDGVHAAFRDPEGLARELIEARRDGFSGKLAIHPDQVAPINAAFTPSPEEVAHARRVVAAFAAAGSAVVSLDGRMLDRPHLAAAQRLLASMAS